MHHPACPQYLERKRSLIKDGRWAKASQHATQYHDVLGFHAGTFVRYTAQVIIVLQLLGTGTAQVSVAAHHAPSTKSHARCQASVFGRLAIGFLGTQYCTWPCYCVCWAVPVFTNVEPRTAPSCYS